MASYNPNSIWDSKEKKYVYDPDPSSDQSKKPPQQPQPQNSGGGNDGGGEPSFFHRHNVAVFTVCLILGITLVGFVIYLLLPPPAPNIAISFSEPNSVSIGTPFPFSVTVSNESKSVLKNAQLQIMLPPGVALVGQDPSQRVVTQQIDTLSSQTINPPQTLELIATDNAGTSQPISVQLGYQTANTGATQYQAQASTNVEIGSQSAISLSYNAPSNIFSGQNFDLTVNYQNNTSGTLQDAQVQMTYPPAFSFVQSSIRAADATNDIWNIGTLPPNASGTFTITGNIVGPANAQYVISGSPVENISSTAYVLNTSQPSAATFSLSAAPLSITMTVNNTSTYIAKLGDSLNYTITYTNNSNVTFQGVNIQATLIGGMYDLSSLQSKGSFDSTDDIVTWNAANIPQLSSLAPGQAGSVNFSITTKDGFPITLPSDKDYTVQTTAQIASPTIVPNTQTSNTMSITSLTTKLGGKINLFTTGYLQSGPYPPKVNTPTTYTIHWDITNYSTDQQNVTVSAYLQSGTTFTGQPTSNVGSSTPVYNASTGQITWTIPVIPATTGVIGHPAEAVFQVVNTPSVNQVGQTVTLLGETSLSSTDEFTGQTLSATANPITTQLQDDTSVTNDNRGVTP